MTSKLQQPNLNPAMAQGIEFFNQRQFFECHEVLEDAWRVETGYWRDFYQGLIKVAVSFYHAERGNYEGALKVLSSGLPQLEPYCETCHFIDLKKLIRVLNLWLRRFEERQDQPTMLDLAEVPLIH